MNKDLFGNIIPTKEEAAAIKQNTNPLRVKLGPGPAGTKCRTCAFLYAKVFSKKYYKCSKRRNTNGPATDHRVRWDSCKMYKKRAD